MGYLAWATLYNFQRHKEIKVKFTPGLNIIKGDNFAGKSTILRALAWVIMNKPRAGHKKYQRINSKGNPEVHVGDSEGNVVIRKKDKYIVNGEELKAFNKEGEVPEPVRAIFPMSSINWQKQLDSNFLITENGGNAAKILNKAIGLEDQELILKELKIELSENKSEIKRLTINASEHTERIDKLREIPKHKEKAEELVEEEDEIADILDHHERLDEIRNNIKIVDKNIGKYKVDHHFPVIDSLMLSYKGIEAFEKRIETLQEIIEEINEKDTHDIKCLNSFIKKCDELISEKKEEQETESQLERLSSFIDTDNTLSSSLISMEKEIKEKQTIFDSHIKVCPLCGRGNKC